MTTLSVCMIVRDESELLPEFLCTAQGLYHELCVVDTGSTDGTVQILEDAGAKVKQMPWEDDFSKARNASLEMATGDWILVLDADELVNDEFKTSVTQTILLDEAGAATIPIRNMLDNGTGVMSFLPRMFRNDKSIRFQHAIHEDITDSLFAYLGRTNKSIVSIGGLVEHLGYVRERASARNKKSRDTQMLKAAIKKNPDDLYNWYKLMEQTRFWDDSQMSGETAPAALQAVERAKPEYLREAHFGGELLVMIAAGLYPEAHKPALLFLYPDAPQQALEFLLPWEGRIRPSAAYYLRRGEFHEMVGNKENFELAMQDFDTCIGLRNCTANTQLATVRPLLGMARVAMAVEEMDDALRLLNLALAQSPRDAEALLALATLSRELGSPKEVQNIVDAYVQTYGDAPELHGALGEAALRAGDTQSAVEELQIAVGEQADQSPYSTLLDEALLAAL